MSLCWLSVSLAATWEVGPDSAFPTLSAALDQALDGDIIEVQPGEYEGPIYLADRTISIVSVGGSAVTTLLPPPVGDVYSVVEVDGPAQITLRGFTLSGQGRTGGLFIERADVFAEDLVFQDGIGPGFSHIRVSESSFTLVDSSFESRPEVLGAHGSVYASEAVFEGVTFQGGHAPGSGGALYVEVSDIELRSCTFSDNQSAGEGGAVQISNPASISNPPHTTTIEDSLFLRNVAPGYGSALLQDGGTLLIYRSTFQDNAGRGAVNHANGQLFQLEDSRFEDNTGLAYSAGISLYNVLETEIVRSTFVGNTTDGDGAALVMAGQSQSASIAGNLFCNNEGLTGGAVLLNSYDILEASVDHNVFVDNRSTFGGAAVAVTRATASFFQNTIVDSSTSSNLGAVWVGYGANATLLDNAIVNSKGGAILRDPYAGTVETHYNLLFNNDLVASGLASDPTTVEAEPGFRDHVSGDCTSDLRPAAGSALVDAGHPELQDGDGSRADIGAYGGPGASTLLDVDGDGAITDDCAPFNPQVTLASEEIPADGLDQDCDGTELCYVDADGDGTGGAQTATAPFGCTTPGVAPSTGDCDDTDASRIAECPLEPGLPGLTGEPLPAAWFCGTAAGRPVPWSALWILGVVMLRVRSRSS